MLNQLDRRKLGNITMAASCLAVACIIGIIIPQYPLLALVVVVVGFLVGLVLLRPFWGVPITLFLGMCGDLQHFDAGLSIVKAVMVLMLIGFLAQLASRTVHLKQTGLELPLLLYTAVFVLGYVRDLDRWADAITWLGYPIYFILVLQLVRTRRQIEWSLAAAGLGATLAAGVALLQWFGIDIPILGTTGLMSSTEQWLQRSSGLTHDPNAAAYPMIIAIPLFLAVALSVTSKVLKIMLLACPIVIALGLATTFSRSGYLGAGVAVASLMLMMPLRKSVVYAVLSCAIIFVVFQVIPDYFLAQRFHDVEENRSQQYVIGARLLAEHPLAGAGIKAFTRETEKGLGEPLEPHANILTVATTAGLPGLAILAVLLWGYAGAVRASMRKTAWSPLKFYAAGTIAALLGFQVQGFFIGNMGWFVIWGVAALPLCCLALGDARHSNRFLTPGAQRTRYLLLQPSNRGTVDAVSRLDNLNES